MNILFFLTPKAECAFLEEDESLREAMDRMEVAGFTALPLLGKDGRYLETLTEGDLLRAVKTLCVMDLRQAEKHSITECTHRRETRAVSVNTQIDDLVNVAIDQNFVPVVDDKNAFIGIVTRKAILQYFLDRYIAAEQAVEEARQEA